MPVSAVPPKPLAAGTVQIDPAAIVDGRVVVTTDPVAGLEDASVVFASTGEAEITSTGEPVSAESTSTSTATVVVDGPAEPADPEAAVLADASDSTVEASLQATDPAGIMRTASDTVWVDEFEGETLVSAEGELDLRLQRVDVLEDDGTIDAAEANELRAEVTGGGAESTESVAADVTCVDLCVDGQVEWTDSEGGTHPVDRAVVKIFDDDGGTEQLLGTTTTDAGGEFEVTGLSNTDTGGTGGQDVFVRVLADGPGFTFATAHIDSGTDTDVPSGSRVSQHLIANNTNDNDTAFSIHAALTIAHDAVASLHGSALPAIPVVFPDGSGSFYDGDALHLLRLDRFDWDVALHEFGHYVADELNIEDNPGGQHSFSQNLSDARNSKSIGTRLAWGEGWPTYFAVSTLFGNLALDGVPNAGDVRYQDTEDSTLDVSLEGPATLGEDNERTVMNVLWDLFDAPSDGQDHLTMSTQLIWDTLDAGDPHTLSAAYALFSPNRRNESANCVFTRGNVAPRLDAPASVGPNPPTFRWRRGNGGTHRNNSFSVAFRSNAGQLLYNSPYAAGQSYAPSQARWTSIRNHAGGTVRVSVVGRQVDSPATGPYRSCSKFYGV